MLDRIYNGLSECAVVAQERQARQLPLDRSLHAGKTADQFYPLLSPELYKTMRDGVKVSTSQASVFDGDFDSEGTERFAELSKTVTA